jgi:hypothetical protein
MNISKTCQKIQKWILFHPGEESPAFVVRHTMNCSDCSAFAKEEQWIQNQIQSGVLKLPTIPLEQSLKVKQAIWESSRVLSQKKQKVSYLFPKVAGSLTILSILILFFFAPLFQGETYFGFQVNQQLSGYIRNNETVNVALREDASVSESLKFASQYVQTPQEKSFYFSTNSLSKENYLLIKYLSKKTKVDASQIYLWLAKGGYAYMLRMLNLPYQKTVSEIQKYIDQFRKSSLLPNFSIDGYVVWVDYGRDSIWIDSYNKEIRLDGFAMQSIHVGYYANFYLQEKDDVTSCIKMEKSLFLTKVLTGIADLTSNTKIYLQGNPVPIKVTSKTIFNEPIGSTQNNESKVMVRIRALEQQKEMTAITVTPLVAGIDRTMTGSIDQTFKYGFTLSGLKLSFCFEALPKTPLTNLPPKTIITVTGKDYGKYFLVTSFMVITPSPSVNEGTRYYLAKADIQQKLIPMDGHFDFVVYRDQKLTYLASGKTVSVDLGMFPVGSKIKVIPGAKGTKPTISFVEMGNSLLLQSNVILLKKVENGAYLYSSDQKNNRILLFPKKGQILPDKGILQGIMIQYPLLSIMIDYRLFQMKSLTTTRGLITKIMEDKKLFVLDNGILLQLDPWSQINGGNLGIGKTLQLFGVQENGIFKAYVVTVEKEMVMFKGVIVEIDRAKQRIKLDSGEIIFWNSETNMQLLKAQFEKGDLIYIKAYKNETTWFASDIWIPAEGGSGLGDSA